MESTHPPFKSTYTTKIVLAHLLDTQADGTTYGYAIRKATGLESGTIYPILARLEKHGWVASGWETVDAAHAGRPARRFYVLTPLGAKSARDMLGQ
jgi:DNA-binding PadR family transcriptional regulator